MKSSLSTASPTVLSQSQSQSLDATRSRLLAHRSSLHKTRAHAIATTLPAATARALAARKRHIKAAAALDHATLRAASARTSLAKLLHSTADQLVPPACTSCHQLAAQLVSKSQHRVQEYIVHASALTDTPPPPLSTADTHEIARLSTAISDLASSLVATRADSVKLRAFRDALFTGPPPTPNHVQPTPLLLSETQHVASSLASAHHVSLPLTRHLAQSRQSHASQASQTLTAAHCAVVKHAAILRILVQSHAAVHVQAETMAHRIQWVRDKVIGECIRKVTPKVPATDGMQESSAQRVARVTTQLAAPPAPASHHAELIASSQAVQTAIHALVAASPLPALAAAGNDEVAERVSEEVTELTLSVPRAAEMVGGHGSLQSQDQVGQDEDWVRWLMGEVGKVGQGYCRVGGGGAQVRRGVAGEPAARRMLDEYL